LHCLIGPAILFCHPATLAATSAAIFGAPLFEK
jgi:hypothetical protein